MKKYLLSIGAALSAFAPIATTMSCNNNQEHQPTGGKDTKPTEKEKKQAKLIAEKNLGFDSTTGSKKPADLEPTPTDEEIKKYNEQMKKFNQEQIKLFKAKYKINEIIYKIYKGKNNFTFLYTNSNKENKINVNGKEYFVNIKEFKAKDLKTSKALLLYEKKDSKYIWSIYDKEKNKIINLELFKNISDQPTGKKLYYDDTNNFLIVFPHTVFAYKHNDLLSTQMVGITKDGYVWKFIDPKTKNLIIIDDSKTTGRYFIDLPNFADVSNSSEELDKRVLKVLVSQTEGGKGFVILYTDKDGKERLNVGGKDFSSQVKQWKEKLMSDEFVPEKLSKLFKEIYKAYASANGK